ncbi:MAG: DUF4097 family beta strand repeat-containing protein [Sedimentisphaerales bacterium]
MRKYLPVTLLACCLVLTALICGCCMCWGWPVKMHYERTEQLSASMAGIEQIKIDTSFGDVKIRGADTTECKAIAKINGQAPTLEEARQLAEQTKITLETEGKVLVFKVEKPTLKNNRSIGISYDVTVPTRTGIKCETSFGGVELKNITGDVDAKTSFGKIDLENITGNVQLDTSYGEVDCEGITTGYFSAKSSFGKMDIEFSDACPADIRAKIETSFGEVDVDIPPNFAGDIAVETNFGSVKTELPITVKGDVSKTRLNGTIGQGKGRMDLKTSFGSIKIK